MPLNIYNSLDSLKRGLAKFEDPAHRLGPNQTIVFAVRKLEYNPKYPILDADDLEREGSLGLSEDESDDSIEWLEDVGSPTVVCKSEVDALVIQEPLDDEFMGDSDDGDRDDEISRNMRKIRPQRAEKAKPPPTKVLKETTSNAATVTWQPKHPSRVETPNSDRQESLSMLEPDWNALSKMLGAKKFGQVLKYLENFKEQVKNTEAARSLPKDLVLKCILEDETDFLMGTLSLIYYIGYSEDVDFWSELVKRFKRKLFRPAFKSKANSDLIYESYKKAMLSLSKHSRDRNLIFKLPYNDILFLIDPLKICQQNNPTDLSNDSVTPNCNNLTNSSIQNDKTNSSDQNRAPPQRQVTMFQKASGDIGFRVRKRLKP